MAPGARESLASFVLSGEKLGGVLDEVLCESGERRDARDLLETSDEHLCMRSRHAATAGSWSPFGPAFSEREGTAIKASTPRPAQARMQSCFAWLASARSTFGSSPVRRSSCVRTVNIAVGNRFELVDSREGLLAAAKAELARG